MKKSVIIGIVVVIIILIIIIGFLYINRCRISDNSKCNKKCNIDSDCISSCGCGPINKNEKCDFEGRNINCEVLGPVKCINNKCQIESTQINNSNNCSNAGEDLYKNNKWNCCEGFVAIPKVCYINDTNGIPSSLAQICSDCGNGICESWESNCNCPKDCEQDVSCIKSQDCKIDSISCKCININESLTILPPNAGAPAKCDVGVCNCQNNKCKGFIGIL
jgi:hypothetical protein